MSTLFAWATYQLAPPIVVALFGFWAMFRLADRERAATPATDCDEAPACLQCQKQGKKWSFIDVVLLVIAVGCLVTATIWGLNIMGYEPNPYGSGW